MSFNIKITNERLPSVFDPLGDGGTITAKYSNTFAILPEYLISEIVSKIADKFIEEHYVEIEKNIDPKVLAAVVSAQAGAEIEKKMQEEVMRVRNIADEALRRVKRLR